MIITEVEKVFNSRIQYLTTFSSSILLYRQGYQLKTS